MVFMVSSQFPKKGTLFASPLLSRVNFYEKPLTRWHLHHTHRSLQVKRGQWDIMGKFNVISILGFHTPGLSSKKPSLALYVWFGASCVVFFACFPFFFIS